MCTDSLEQLDIDGLVELLLRSQQSRERKALCINIGIDHKRLNFIENTSDQDFFIRLIHYINETGNNEAICNLCCKELLPVFRNPANTPLLEKIIVKLGCNRPITTLEFIPFFKNKNIFLISGIIFVIILTIIGFPLYKQISGNKPNLNCQNIVDNTSKNLSSAKNIKINLPNNVCVERLQKIQGKVTVQDAKTVWIVVKPLIGSTYYVQEPTNINDGEFRTQIYVGDNSTLPGTEFEIRAFIKPSNKLNNGQKLDNWPDAKWVSDIILIKRK